MGKAKQSNLEQSGTIKRARRRRRASRGGRRHNRAARTLRNMSLDSISNCFVAFPINPVEPAPKLDFHSPGDDQKPYSVSSKNSAGKPYVVDNYSAYSIGQVPSPFGTPLSPDEISDSDDSQVEKNDGQGSVFDIKYHSESKKTDKIKDDDCTKPYTPTNEPFNTIEDEYRRQLEDLAILEEENEEQKDNSLKLLELKITNLKNNFKNISAKEIDRRFDEILADIDKLKSLSTQ